MFTSELGIHFMFSTFHKTIFIFCREFLEHKNATFNENGTLSYVPVRYSVPIPERSVGDPHKDIVIAANLPLLGISSAAAKISPFASLAISSIMKTTKSQPILNLTVHDFLWGYDDSLVRLANTVLPNYITFERFGLMERVSFSKEKMIMSYADE
jgi:scavenger receptor class B, member 1